MKLILYSLKLLTLIKIKKQKEFFDQIETYSIRGDNSEIKYLKHIWIIIVNIG